MPRGRKLDDQKRLNRQLINQRAFRERRTARLTELEERKNQLEVENAQLRGNHIRTEGDTTQTSRVPVPCPSCLTHDTHRDELVSLIQSEMFVARFHTNFKFRRLLLSKWPTFIRP